MSATVLDLATFNSVCLSLSEKVEAIAFEKLAQHGYVGVAAVEDAPNSYTQLTKAYYSRSHGNRFLVWNGASETSVYNGCRVNYLFRAWHDLLHIELEAQFDEEGEYRCANYQCSHSSLTDLERQIIWIDIVDQFRFEKLTGEFPVDQKKFAYTVITQGFDAAVAECRTH